MTRRERLMATLEGKPVDRPAVSFYEIGGWKLDPDDLDEYNIYNDPSWRPLIRLAEKETDVIRTLPATQTPSADNPREEFFQTETWEENRSRFIRTTLNVGGRTMTETTRRDAETDTIWTTEHLLKNVDDLKAYLQLPEEVFDYEINCSNLIEAEKDLGDAGIVMVDTGDPLCAAAALFSMEEYTIIAMTETDLFHQLLKKQARHLYKQTEQVARDFPGRLWRIVGSEYASEPYLPPRLYEEYVVRYTGPMVDIVKKHGGYVRIHSHGRLKNILSHIAEMGADGLDPIEPPHQGDVELIDVRRQYGRQMVLFGNIESTEIENLPPAKFEARVTQALSEGTDGQGRGFVLMPSACPYGRTIDADTMTNYETMVRLATRFGG
ncbi:MAG: hypothetical protein K8S55_10950 [Phycisphaerae bacterium]|nr:hypothetical protein [Phycisphaerae bacterium]